MRTLKQMSLTGAILFTVMFSVAALLAAKTINSQTQKPKDETQNTMRWVHEQNDNGDRLRMEVRGKPEFTEDYTDIRSISEGGYVRIEEDRNGQSRRFELRRDGSGQLQRTYFVNGEARVMDEAGRAWLGKIILDAVRQSAIDVDRRVQIILRKQGLKGVLEEINLISSDYAQRHYFQSLIKNGNLNTADLQNVLREAARQLSSDYEQAQLLIGVAEQLTVSESAAPAFFEATGTIESDYEHKRVLTTLLKKSNPSRDVLVRIAGSAAGISSDYEKASVLKEVAPIYLEDAALRTVFFQAVDAISSDYEHRGVLSALLKKTTKLTDEVLAGMLESATRISSDYEKATFLMEASNAYTGDARLRAAFLKAVETIKSDYERGRVLSALLKNKQIG